MHDIEVRQEGATRVDQVLEYDPETFEPRFREVTVGPGPITISWKGRDLNDDGILTMTDCNEGKNDCVSEISYFFATGIYSGGAWSITPNYRKSMTYDLTTGAFEMWSERFGDLRTTFTASWDGTTGASSFDEDTMDGGLSLGSSSGAFQFVRGGPTTAPVPLPASVLALMAGLGALGWAARRRQA
ncbi:VPLPA-CTERM sorting domain-containing protein [Primorskyibacter sp. S187A]|uniref:VPLPA-CTERM sorting domain-containing protein n=1 Tax=Primorskyibacter sp. S187A TaxID=3415130 RepID=UPI003C7ECFC4